MNDVYRQKDHHILATILLPIVLAMFAFSPTLPIKQIASPTPTKKTLATRTITPSPLATNTPAASATITLAPSLTATLLNTLTATNSPTITATSGGAIAPYPSAPLCVDHNNETFHTLWDSGRGCHYDHEHGENPFVPEVAAAFAPLGDLHSLLGHHEISHSNPSSPTENTVKHGGHKIEWGINNPQGCATGFESGTVAVDAHIIGYHGFGRQDTEFEAREHSAYALLRQCKDANPSDKGYVFVITLQNFGEICSPYQGQTLQYPNDFLPRWNCAFGPYTSVDNTSNRTPNDPSQNSNNKWTSKPTGCTFPCTGVRPAPNYMFRLLFDVRDAYQIWDVSDTVHPFHWVWMCGATSYNPVNCRFNNSTSIVREVMGDIPAALDNAAGDSDSRVGRITGEYFVDAHGIVSPSCTTAGGNCYLIILIKNNVYC